MAFGRNISHIFVDLDGNQMDVEIGKQYRVIETVFIADQTNKSFGGAQSVQSGRLLYRLVPPSTIREEPEVE